MTRACALADLPWYFAGGASAAVGLRSSFAPMMDARRQGTSSEPDPGRAEEVMIEHCWAIDREWGIRRRLEACGREMVEVLRLHFGTEWGLDVSPAALVTAEILTLPAVAKASEHDRKHLLSVIVAGTWAKLPPSERDRIRSASEVLVARATRMYETATIESRTNATFAEPNRRARVRYS